MTLMRAPKKIPPYVRTASFESPAHMERHDAEINALLEQHEESRHRSEVRTVIRVAVAEGAWHAVTTYLAIVRKKRGGVCADRLSGDIKAQFRLGNRGERGDWRVE